jgi:hypothetical protein
VLVAGKRGGFEHQCRLSVNERGARTACHLSVACNDLKVHFDDVLDLKEPSRWHQLIQQRFVFI